MARAQREHMQWLVTWLTDLEWQMDPPSLMEWRRMKAEWYRENSKRRVRGVRRKVDTVAARSLHLNGRPGSRAFPPFRTQPESMAHPAER
jgi:hypothetical protein